jgi:hypothetical protein
MVKVVPARSALETRLFIGRCLVGRASVCLLPIRNAALAGNFHQARKDFWRRIFVRRARHKRGGGQQQVSLAAAADAAIGKASDLLALDDALKALSEFDSQLSRIIELRFFWRADH